MGLAVLIMCVANCWKVRGNGIIETIGLINETFVRHHLIRFIATALASEQSNDAITLEYIHRQKVPELYRYSVHQVFPRGTNLSQSNKIPQYDHTT